MMKIFKVLGLLILTMVSLILIVGLLFVNLSPQFGGSPTEEQTESYSKTGHYKEGVFVNELETNMDMDFSAMYETMLEFIKGGENLQPKEDLPVKKIEAQWIEQNKNQLTKLTWFGHSAFLLQLDGKKILIDPMLGESPAPHPMIGVKRYNKEIPIEIKNLPFIDFVIISHDHYDHLDYESVMKLKGKVGKFYMPLGVGTHFKSWGFDENQILELDWWDETMEDNIKLVCTPSRHFSGRGLTDRSATLWSSWVILSEKKKIYFSGDGGFGPHFKEIGDKYGPFDVGLMECGQYNKNWAQIHMMPEQTVQATIDVGAQWLVPVHWGAFTLSLHDWTDPIERVSAEAKRKNVNISTPAIGETIVLEHSLFPNSVWWKGL
jgi:L-ascorbate metabolism protein UlaG (beta-lactamase superfamily)|tara:strand:+ start:24263 stop:25393 length:1131 start_codon:yes stop_codon:yes gene_type:complete